MDLAQTLADGFRRVLNRCRKWPLMLIAVGITISMQSIVLVWQIVESEWVLHNGFTVHLRVDPADNYDFVRGNYFEFIPSVFRHSFPSGRDIVAGDEVIVGTTDPQHTQWAILASEPGGNRPYYRVTVKSANDGYYFLTPPFRRIYLDDDALSAVTKSLSHRKAGEKESIYLIVKHYKDHAMISGIQVGNHSFYQR
ncbi:hypothetical protein EBR57_04855 [bacterium]|nr:hypothetical protein [bacterium]